MPAGPEPPAAARSLLTIPSMRSGVFADRQSPQIVDCALQRGADGAPVEGHADPFDPVIGVEPYDHDRAGGGRVFRGVGERILLRHDQDLRADARDLHRSISGQAAR
jgi:hypothetical protein